MLPLQFLLPSEGHRQTICQQRRRIWVFFHVLQMMLEYSYEQEGAGCCSKWNSCHAPKLARSVLVHLLPALSGTRGIAMRPVIFVYRNLQECFFYICHQSYPLSSKIEQQRNEVSGQVRSALHVLVKRLRLLSVQGSVKYNAKPSCTA